MTEIKAYGKIENGGFWPRNSKVYIQSLKDAGTVTDCLLTITGSNRRTLDQNAYAHALCNAIAVRVNMDGWNFTGYEVYKKIENDYCKVQHINSKTGESVYVVKPLKEYDTQSFFEVIEAARLDYMRKLDIHLSTPAEFYGLTEQAYDLLKLGTINYIEAKKMSEGKV